MTNHVRYTDGQDHSPEKICQTAGYTTFAGACRFIDTLGKRYNGSILANTQTYNPNWAIGCAYGSINVWFSSSLNSSQILCIK